MMKKILVVDDNEKNVKLASETLTYAGYEVLKADNGQTAIETARREKPDLILMDIQIPDMNGIEIMIELRKISDMKDKPVVALTAYAMKGDMESLMSEGFNAYLPKPFAIRELIDTVNKLID